MRLPFILLAGLILSAPTLQAQIKEPVKVTDLLKIKTIGEIHLS